MCTIITRCFQNVLIIYNCTSTWYSLNLNLIFKGKLLMTTKFCWSVDLLYQISLVISLKCFFGNSPADGGASRDVWEINIELVSVMLHWQKGVDGAECLCLQHAYICLPAPQHSPNMHTQKLSHATFPCHQYHTEAYVTIRVFKPLLPECEQCFLMVMMLHLQPC